MSAKRTFLSTSIIKKVTVNKLVLAGVTVDVGLRLLNPYKVLKIFFFVDK